MRLFVRVFGIGADVFLNHRRERRFGQVAVTVYARVYQEIDIVSVSPRLVEAVLGSVYCQAEGTVMSPPPAVG